jgi:hypothetical protein
MNVLPRQDHTLALGIGDLLWGGYQCRKSWNLARYWQLVLAEMAQRRLRRASEDNLLGVTTQ